MRETLEELKALCNVGYTKHSGIELLEIAEGYAVGRVVIDDYHKNPYDTVHGGLTFCLGDLVGGVACRTMDVIPVTLSSNISYFRPLVDTKEIVAKANVVKAGKTTLFVETRIYDDQGVEACMIATTYYNVEGRRTAIEHIFKEE